MVSIGIIISQPGAPVVPEGSREDLVIGSLVTFRNSNGSGITSYKWELIGKPYTSSVTLSSTSASEVSFTPDVVGSYLVQLTINNKLKQRVVAAILTSRHSIRIPASGEGEEIPGGSFKAITESIRTLENDTLNAAMIQGNSVSENDPELNDFLRYNGAEWTPSGKMRVDDLGFRNNQDIFVKIPLSAAIHANSYWEYNAGTNTVKPCWKTIASGGTLPILDFIWNSFPHGSVLKKLYFVASCENTISNTLKIRVEKTGAIWNSDDIHYPVEQFICTEDKTVTSNVSTTFEVPVTGNPTFTHGNSNDDVVSSEELRIRLTSDGINIFRIFSVYAHFQTLSIGQYNGPLVAEGGSGEGQGDGSGDCPITYLETWDQVVADGDSVEGSVEIGVEHGMIYSLIVESIGVDASEGADIELADNIFTGSHELLYQIGLAGTDPRWVPSEHPVWKDRNPFGIEGLSENIIYWRLSNYGSVEMTFRVTIRGMGWKVLLD